MRSVQTAERAISGLLPRGMDVSAPTAGWVCSQIARDFTASPESQQRIIGACKPRNGETLTRTGVTFIGSGYGFALPYDQSKEVWDHARLKDGPFARVRGWYPTQFKEFGVPIYNESSRANGSRWGGMNGLVGASETFDMSTKASAPSLARKTFSMCRLTVFTPPMSRDLLHDTQTVLPMLDYAAKSEIRFLVDQALIMGNSVLTNTGPTTVEAPEGIVGSAATIGIARNTGNTIVKQDIDSLWRSVAGPNRSNALWHCSEETVNTIDEIAMTSGWPESLYTPGGRYANQYPLLKGRPLITNESCSVLGSTGDLVVADWNDYCIYHQTYDGSDSSLSFTVTTPEEKWGAGTWGLPPGAVESRMSDQFLFQNDEVVFCFKARLDGHWLWNQPVININGTKVGPAAYLI